MEAPRFTLRQLEIFLAVARTGNISRAAESLHCSPSAISASVTELERSVHARLCVRKKSRGVVLTPQGRLMRTLAQQLLADAAEVASTLDDSSGELAGVLRLGCYTPLAASFLPPLLQGFGNLHPKVAIELFEGSQDDLAAQMLAGEVDVSLVYESPGDSDLEWVHLLSRRPYVLVAEDHRLASRTTVALPELADDPLILLDLPPSGHYTMAWFRQCGLRPNVRWRTHDIELVRALVGSGLGYAVMLQRQRHNHSLDGAPLHALEIDPPVHPVEVFLVHRRGRATPRRVRAFIDFARERLATPPEWTGAVAVTEKPPSGGKQ
ncbi:LysR family transcriptional regulator [Streptosporangium sp. NPDC051022]|uniref:LysR family transcriptional regulator n=1 Tax=Streptosporangium sp. NPDC051022 TaxID=3155752 RepID=UPI0034138D83